MFGKRLYAWKTIPTSRRFGGTSRDVLALDEDPPRGRPVEAGDQAQRCGLAAPGRAEERDELAALDVEVDAVERDDVAEAAVQLPQLDAGHR